MITENENKDVKLLSSEDFDNIEKFFNHFKIEIPDYLADRIKMFRDTPEGEFTQEEQDHTVAMLSRALLNCDHPLVNDDLWSVIRLRLGENWFSKQFDWDAEDFLAEDPSEESD